MRVKRFILGLVAAGVVSSAALGNIDLEWRPAAQMVSVGDTVSIGLYAVSDDDTDQSISAMDVILTWDPDFLELQGVNNNGPYEWLSSGFPDDSGLDGLNNTWLDGNALYQALAQLGEPAYATPEGLLVTTVEFVALHRTPAGQTTELNILAELGQYSQTRVFDGEIPGYDVTGTLGSAAVTIKGHVNLEWRPAEQTAALGEVVSIGLYAVSDDETDQPMAAMDVILEWDPTYLALLWVDNNGPYEWLYSGFPDDSGLDDLNRTFLDGNALYQALAQLGDPACATPEGLLVTTVEFVALVKTPVGQTTELKILEEFGQYSRTRVFDGEIPGWDVHGTLGIAGVAIVCGNGCVGDLDGDCDVDQCDLGILLANYGIDDGGDLDGDGDTDQSDLGILLADWGCGVAP
jgi:hypothetical protein